MLHPKLEIMKYVFNRPEMSGAFGEVVRAYINYKITKGSSDPLGEVEGEVLLAIKDLEAERKNKQEPPLRVKTGK